MVISLEALTSRAKVPDQLLHYVQAVSGLKSSLVPGGVVHCSEDHAVLVCYDDPDRVDEALAGVLKRKGLRHVAVLAPVRPASAPDNATVTTDSYWRLELPIVPPRGKLANLLRRARREVTITASSGWSAEHQALAEEFCQRKQGLDDGSRYLFRNLAQYVGSSPDVSVVSALDASGSLLACAVADYTALGTAFYMFAFRRPSAPPGTADLLLWHLADEAGARGHQQLNLGLGIDPGVEFFKRKWQASCWLPLVETSWDIRPTGLWRRLFG